MSGHSDRRSIRDGLAAHAARAFVRRAAVLLLTVGATAPESAAQVRVLIASGLGGEAKYAMQFARDAARLDSALRVRFGVAPQDVQWFGEDSTSPNARYRGRATKANLERAIAGLATSADAALGTVLVFLGHGSGEGEETRISLPGPDMTAAELRRWLVPFGTHRLAVVVLTSASGEMLPVLSAPGRVIITATKSSFERNESHFGGYFVDALASRGADLDKDGRVSLLEAYQYALRETVRFYETDSKIQTEHPQLDDDGDRVGTAEPSSKSADGFLARRFFLDPGPRARVVADARLDALYRERFAREDAVDEVKRRKATMSKESYEAELERALVALARTSQAIRIAEGAP